MSELQRQVLAPSPIRASNHDRAAGGDGWEHSGTRSNAALGICSLRAFWRRAGGGPAQFRGQEVRPPCQNALAAAAAVIGKKTMEST